MTTSFEVPSHEALIAEQAVVQAEKFQGRLLDEYTGYIFPCQSFREPRGSAVVDFVRPFIGSAKRATFDGVLAGLVEAREGSTVNWVDMGGGRALAMRQSARKTEVMSKLAMTNVDLFDFGLDGLEPDELEYLENLAPGMTASEAEPALIVDNVETVKLPEPADIITSIESMQYLNNPLEALANWYNQLADNGIMIVTTEHDWANWIRYDREPGSNQRDETPTKHLLQALTRATINYAATYESDWENGFRPDVDPSCFRTLVLQKKPSTSLRVNSPVTEVWVNPSNFKAVYYDPSTEVSLPVVEVLD